MCPCLAALVNPLPLPTAPRRCGRVTPRATDDPPHQKGRTRRRPTLGRPLSPPALKSKAPRPPRATPNSRGSYFARPSALLPLNGPSLELDEKGSPASHRVRSAAGPFIMSSPFICIEEIPSLTRDLSLCKDKKPAVPFREGIEVRESGEPDSQSLVRGFYVRPETWVGSGGGA